MSMFKDSLMRYLTREGIKFKDVNEFKVTVTYNCDNMPSCCVNVIFDKDDSGSVAFRSWDIGNIPENKVDAVLKAINEVNNKYRWVKFCIDKDRDISAEMDAMTYIESTGPQCLYLIRRMVAICDEAYPIIMRARWGA